MLSRKLHSLKFTELEDIPNEATRIVKGATKLLNYHHSSPSTQEPVGKVLPIEEKYSPPPSVV